MIDPRAQASAHNISASSPTLPSCGAQFDPTIISEILGGAQRCFEVHFTPELDSTMNLRTFCEKADIPIRAGLVLIAGHQTSGVGRSGAWNSGRDGQDITMSVVLPDTSSPKKHLLIHIAATLAVANALDEAVRLETNQGEPHPIFRIKLPNDVRVDVGSHFGKICGSLGVGALNEDIKREHALRGWRYPDDYLVMGIGINLSNEVLSRPEGLRFPASSLEFVTGRVFRRELILGLVLRNLDEMLRLTEGNPALLLQKAQAKLALGAGGAAILDTRGGFSDSVVVLELGEDGLRFLHRGELKTVPVEDILRLYPEEPTLPFLR